MASVEAAENFPNRGMNELLEAYPVIIKVSIAWGEMDAFQHVNNIVYFRYFESARMAYFEKTGYNEILQKTGQGPILASTKCKFILPLTYPDEASMGTRVSQVQSDRFLMEYCIVSHKHQKVAAVGEGMVVSYDYNLEKKVPLPEPIREAISELERAAR